MRFCVCASMVRLHGGAAPLVWIALLALSLLPGCQNQEEIRRYTVQKMPEVKRSAKSENRLRPPMRPAGHGNVVSERLLGAITTQGRTLWVFKVAGPKEAVAAQMPNFLSLMQSLKFPDNETDAPEWKLPEGWTDKKEADPRGMRYTTLLVKAGDEELPLTVTRLPLPGDRPIDGMPLMVVNMWCEQLGLSEKTAADLKSEDQPKDAEVRQLDVDGKRVTLVNFLAAEAPVREPPVVAKGVPQWKVPEGWKTDPGNEFSLAAFAVSDGSRTIKTTVSRAGGDLLQNLNRWRGQLGLKPWSAEEMSKTVKTLSVDGHDGTQVELVGTDARSGKPSCTLGVIVPRGGEAWFFKLTGDVELAQREKDNFVAFVQSVKFE